MMHFLFVFEFSFNIYSCTSAVALAAPVAQEVRNIIKNGSATQKMVRLKFSNSTKVFKKLHKIVCTNFYYKKSYYHVAQFVVFPSRFAWHACKIQGKRNAVAWEFCNHTPIFLCSELKFFFVIVGWRQLTTSQWDFGHHWSGRIQT